MFKPFLSLIIPAHNEERRLPITLEQVLAFLEDQPYSSEALVIENASQDRTLQIAQDFAARRAVSNRNYSPTLRVIQENQRGKGAAVRRGMLAASGEYRFMCDSDLSMPVAEINRFLPPSLADFDIAIASREAQGAIRYNEPTYRHLGGRAVNLMIRLLVLPGLNDTQCGFKCFRDAVAEDLFRCQTLVNWSFDIEILYIARLRGCRIVEMPIPWHFNPETKLNPVGDAIRMGFDILTVRKNALQGKYERKLAG